MLISSRYSTLIKFLAKGEITSANPIQIHNKFDAMTSGRENSTAFNTMAKSIKTPKLMISEPTKYLTNFIYCPL